MVNMIVIIYHGIVLYESNIIIIIIIIRPSLELFLPINILTDKIERAREWETIFMKSLISFWYIISNH